VALIEIVQLLRGETARSAKLGEGFSRLLHIYSCGML